jgi:hypothetical protein
MSSLVPSWLPLSTLSLTLALAATGCAHAPPGPQEVASAIVEEKPADDAPREALGRFLDAVKADDWDTAWSLLSAPLRARYTPERLRDDFKREPLATERVSRARLALKGPVRVTASGAEFPIGEERAVRLVREAGEYRIAAIE